MDILYNVLILPLENLMYLILSTIAPYTGFGFGIIILSLLVNIGLLPIYSIAERIQNTERNIQFKIYPALLEIKQKYRGEAQFYKMKDLYQKHNYHPIKSMRSILGFAIQLPVFISAFIMLSNYSELNTVIFLSIFDLGKPDGLLFGINLLPFVMTVTNLLSVFSYTVDKQTQQEKNQLILMAVLFFVLLYSSPSALLIYWTTSNIFSYLKNLIIHNF